MAKGQVPGGNASGKGSPGAKGTTGRKGRGGGGKGGGKGGNKKNKPCSCSKKPGKSNRDKANSTKGGGKSRCQNPSCGMTGAQRGAIEFRKLMSQKQAGKNVKPSSLLYWRTKGSKIVADHKYPATKIKKLPGFATLEKRTNLEAARKVMTAHFNMQKLCANCNRKKSAGGNFQPDKLQAMIDGFLKK